MGELHRRRAGALTKLDPKRGLWCLTSDTGQPEDGFLFLDGLHLGVSFASENTVTIDDDFLGR